MTAPAADAGRAGMAGHTLAVEVLLRGTWAPTDTRNVPFHVARETVRAWLALGCSARIVDLSEGGA